MVTLVLIGFTFSYSQSLFKQSSQENTNKEGSITFNGYTRGSAIGLNDNYDFASLFGEFSFQSKFSFGKAFMYSDIRFRSGTQFNEKYNTLEIKEAYAGLKSNKIDLLLGEQIVTWGRTDGFNPTNSITPNNYFFLSANPDDQKLSNFMLRIEYNFSSQINWEIIGIPIYKPSVYRYELFEMGKDLSFNKATFPNKEFKNGTFATRLNFNFSSIGFSFSYFNGYEPFYGFNIKSIDFSTGKPVIVNEPSFYAKQSVGFDMELPIGSWILRSEAAGSLTEQYEVNMSIPNPDISYVAGLEHDFWGFHTILQYVGKYTYNYSDLIEPSHSDPSNPLAIMKYAEEMSNYELTQFNRKIFHQQKEWNHAASLTLTKSFAYETLKTELTGYYNFTSEEYIVRPKISWLAGNGLKISIGGNWMNGPDNSLFSHASQLLNGAFVEFKTSF